MIDKFCMLNAASLDAQVIPLIGVVCLQLSVKIHEHCMLNSEQTLAICKSLECPGEVNDEMLL